MCRSAASAHTPPTEMPVGSSVRVGGRARPVAWTAAGARWRPAGREAAVVGLLVGIGELMVFAVVTSP
jgi:hypothetical protein